MIKYKLIAMDLDGTLTQHKSRLDPKNTAILEKLSQKYNLLMVGAGSSQRIYEQMNRFPIQIIGNYGMQQSIVKDGVFTLVKDEHYQINKDFFEQTITRLRKETGFTKYKGDNVEFHLSGAVTFPLIGTKAELKEKLEFDPDGKLRSAIYNRVKAAFNDYNCFIGGTSSFDIVKKQYDKYKAITQYIESTGISKNEVLFIGDDFKPGGNDEQVMLGGIDCLVITDYTALGDKLAEIGVL